MTKAKSVSVAMATFNGLPYLPEQMASILGQTVAPFEIVVCDDASTDGTWEYLRQVAAADPRVQIHRNEVRLGSTKNFERAITLCTGDVIFLSDQDDVWEPRKIEELAGEMVRCSAVLAMSNGTLVSPDGTSLGVSLWEANGIDVGVASALQSVSASELLARRAYATGSAVCFDASLKDEMLPIPGDVWHDQWIALMASLLKPGALRLLDLTLYRYRQHPGNQIGARGRGRFERARAEIRSHRDVQVDLGFCKEAIERVRRIAPHPGDVIRGTSIRRTAMVLEHRMLHAQSRCAYVEGLRPWLDVLTPGRLRNYREYSRGFSTVIRDVLTRLFHDRNGKHGCRDGVQ